MVSSGEMVCFAQIHPHLLRSALSLRSSDHCAQSGNTHWARRCVVSGFPRSACLQLLLRSAPGFLPRGYSVCAWAFRQALGMWVSISPSIWQRSAEIAERRISELLNVEKYVVPALYIPALHNQIILKSSTLAKLPGELHLDSLYEAIYKIKNLDQNLADSCLSSNEMRQITIVPNAGKKHM